MDEFCGDIRNFWGLSAKGYLTHCFDDLVLFGATYAFLFAAGSYRAWTLLHIPPVPEFPYSTLHSVKVCHLALAARTQAMKPRPPRQRLPPDLLKCLHLLWSQAIAHQRGSRVHACRRDVLC